MPRGADLRWERLADDSRVRVTCLLAAHLQVTPGVLAGHAVTFQIANAALLPKRAEVTLHLTAHVAARPGVTYLGDSVPLEAFAHGDAVRLRLEVNDAGDGISRGHAVWADARIGAE